MPLWLRFNRADEAPSFLAWMTLAEFATRLQRDCRLPSIFYPGRREFYYMQTPLTPSMLEDVDLQGPPFTALTRKGEYPNLNIRITWKRVIIINVFDIRILFVVFGDGPASRLAR